MLHDLRAVAMIYAPRKPTSAPCKLRFEPTSIETAEDEREGRREFDGELRLEGGRPMVPAERLEQVDLELEILLWECIGPRM